MPKVHVVADSSCDFDPELAKKIGFSLVPLTVTVDNKHFIDREDISTELFFKLLKESKELPKTSQPSPESFMKEFRKHSDCDYIICVCVSSKVSGTANSATMAKHFLEEEGFKPKIVVIDSLNTSVTIGLMAKTASIMAAAGKSIEDILSKLEDMQKKLSIYFILDTLEYVRKGGRIGNITAIVGTLLNIKPILTFFKGSPTNIDKCRGFAQAKDKLIAKFMDTAADLSEVTIVHAQAFDRAKELSAELSNLIKDIKIQVLEVGAVMGTYTGPGAIGIAFEEKLPRWA